MSAKLTPQQIVDELLADIREWSAREKENQIVAAYDGGMIAGMNKAITLIQRNLIDDGEQQP